MLIRRTKIQLIAFVVISVVAIVYALIRFAGLGTVFGNSGYTVKLQLNESGGIFTHHDSSSWLAWAASASRLRAATLLMSTVVVIRCSFSCMRFRRSGSGVGGPPISMPSSAMRSRSFCIALHRRAMT